jgi:fluoroquinolone transport system ATP-binding protein
MIKMIDVNNLTFTYPKAARPTLQGMSFSIERGELFGFLGPSGTGKSTTEKILMGLLKNYTGFVAVFSKSLADWKSDYYEWIGVAFEFPNHFLKLTALENLTYDSSLEPVSSFLWFGVGFGLPLLILSFLSGAAQRWITRQFALHARLINVIGGILLVAIGLYDLWSNWTVITLFLS